MRIATLLAALIVLGFIPGMGKCEETVSKPDGPEQIDLAKLEARIQAVCKRLTPAIVQITYGEKAPFADTGVIVSADGLVLSSSGTSRRVLDEKQLRIRLADGQVVGGQALGWSSELGVGVLKINTPGPWVFAPMGDGNAVKAGDYCLAMGYQRFHATESDSLPTARLGEITRSSKGKWFNSSCLLFAGPYSVFDLEGRLLGMTNFIRGSEPFHVSVTRVREHWADLQRAPASEAVQTTNKVSPQKVGKVPSKETREAVIEKAKRASVKIVDFKLSGTIVTPDGYVVTCEHNQGLPGQKLTVELSDGRTAKAVLLGIDAIIDIGLIKILDKGPWHFIPMGESHPMKTNDWCAKVGYPIKGDKQVQVTAEAHLVRPSFTKRPRRKGIGFEPNFWTSGSANITQGASGGGLFDKNGRIVGVTLGKHGDEADYHARIELFRQHWETLAAKNHVDRLERPPLALIQAEFLRISPDHHRSVVRVSCDGRRKVLGTIVRSDGWILTKLSELTGEIACRLSDGGRFSATLKRKSQEHDLALLKIEAVDLPVVEWSQHPTSEVGILAHAIVSGKPLSPGIVGLAARPSPRARGSLGVRLTTEEPPRVDHIYAPDGAVPLQKGDVLLKINGMPVLNPNAIYELLDSKHGSAGEKLRVEVRRNGKLVKLQYELPAVRIQSSPRLMSRRWWGYPSVMGTEIRLTSRQCGCPLIDRTGEVIGIVIACRADYAGWGLRHVIPSKIAQTFVVENT